MVVAIEHLKRADNKKWASFLEEAHRWDVSQSPRILLLRRLMAFKAVKADLNYNIENYTREPETHASVGVQTDTGLNAVSTQTDIGDDALAAEGDKALNREASKSDHSATLPIVDSESVCEDASSVSICSQPSQVIQHCQP